MCTIRDWGPNSSICKKVFLLINCLLFPSVPPLSERTDVPELLDNGLVGVGSVIGERRLILAPKRHPGKADLEVGRKCEETRIQRPRAQITKFPVGSMRTKRLWKDVPWNAGWHEEKLQGRFLGPLSSYSTPFGPVFFSSNRTKMVGNRGAPKSAILSPKSAILSHYCIHKRAVPILSQYISILSQFCLNISQIKIKISILSQCYIHCPLKWTLFFGKT